MQMIAKFMCHLSQILKINQLLWRLVLKGSMHGWHVIKLNSIAISTAVSVYRLHLKCLTVLLREQFLYCGQLYIRLKHFLKTIGIKVVYKLTGCSFLSDLKQQFQIRDRTKVRKQFIVQRVIFDLGSPLLVLSTVEHFPLLMTS